MSKSAEIDRVSKPSTSGESYLGGSIRALRLLEEHGPLAKTHVARSLGITLPTALGHFRKLREERLVVATSKQSYSGPGRPLELWDIDRASNCTIGLVVTPPTLAIALADFDDKLLLQEEHDLSDCGSADEIAAVIERFLERAAEYCRQSHLSIRWACGCLPGPSDQSDSFAVNMPQLHANEIKTVFRRVCGVDCQMATLSTGMAFGETDDFPAQTVVALIEWELGIAVVPFCNRQVLFFDDLPNRNRLGLHDYAHMPIRRDGRLCACGRRGCLEAYAGGRAIIQDLGRADVRRLADLVKLVKEGDKQVMGHLRRAAYLLGEGLSWFVLLMGVDQVRFTGPLSTVLTVCEGAFSRGLRKYLSEEQVARLTPQASPDPLRGLLIGSCRAARHSFMNGKL